MSTQTKIVVIPLKSLIIGIIVAAAIAAVIAFALVLASSESDHNRQESLSVSAMSGNYDASDTGASSEIYTPLDMNSEKTYTPGVYTASILLDGNPVDIQVTVDSDNINSIELVNLSESVTTMYPQLSTTFDEVAGKVMENGGTGITYDSANKYTYSVFIDAIDAALKKSLP